MLGELEQGRSLGRNRQTKQNKGKIIGSGCAVFLIHTGILSKKERAIIIFARHQWSSEED
jgi:hypothetical protein